ncbi:MAG: transcription antitermination factor NusB [Acidimicrobiales bacterium]
MSGSPLHISRRDDREAALALLYEADMSGDSIDEVVLRNSADIDDYSTQMVLGVDGLLDGIDEQIDAVAEDWTVSRMPGIDRSILRMSVWELLSREDIPITAVVSEAVALANQYSTEKSAPFINGVLVKLAELIRPEDD